MPSRLTVIPVATPVTNIRIADSSEVHPPSVANLRGFLRGKFYCKFFLAHYCCRHARPLFERLIYASDLSRSDDRLWPIAAVKFSDDPNYVNCTARQRGRSAAA
jgi:hypothetical protein